MLILLLLCSFSLSFSSQESVTCPTGFTFLNPNTNASCVRFFADPKNYVDARTTCQNFTSGNLISIHNAIDNRVVATFSTNTTNPIWLGLQCSTSSSDPSTCVWDDQTGSASSFSNFVSGNPNVDVGSSVYMLKTGSLAGKWVSADGSYTLLNFFCEVPPTTTPAGNSSCQFVLGNFCYFPHFETLNETASWETCQEECGDPVSIHSSEENAFIRSLFTSSNSSTSTYIHIGAIADPFNDTIDYWMDGSQWDYENIGYRNAQIGICWSMAIQDDIVAAGQWISSHCGQELGFVCKRSRNETCQAGPTLAPAQCNGAQFLSNNGTIFSPNYPFSYIGESHPCSYLITTPSGSLAQISFPELFLDAQSSISIYSNVEDVTPMAVLNGTTRIVSSLNSTSNTLKIVFQPCLYSCESGTFYWKALFSFARF